MAFALSLTQLAAGSTQAQTVAGINPTTFISDAELNVVKNQIAAKTEPYATAYAQLLHRAQVALGVAPRSVVTNGGGHFLSSDQKDTTDYKHAIAMSKAINDLALAWRLSGDARFAAKALKLIDHWALNDATFMSPDMGATRAVSRLRVFITMPGVIYGADLIWGYSGWTSAQRTEFIAWVRKLGVTTRANPADAAKSLQNKEAWRQALIACAGGFLQDSTLRNYAFGEFKRLLPSWIGAPGTSRQGFMVLEWRRSSPKGGLFYSNYALMAMLHTAEIAWQHGVDLYRFKNQGRSLELALDTIAPYNIRPATWTFSPSTGLHPGMFGGFEFAYKRLGKPAYLNVVRADGRPIIMGYGIYGNVTVTHAR